jgi:hypothetical protein
MNLDIIPQPLQPWKIVVDVIENRPAQYVNWCAKRVTHLATTTLTQKKLLQLF